MKMKSARIAFLGVCLFLPCVACYAAPRPQRADPILTGIDVLEAQNFAPLAGKRIGLITNQTGMDRQGRSTIDLLAHAPGVRLVALFSPEHGLRGNVDERFPSTNDSATGIPIYSLYGETLRPTPAMLENLDALVFDVQDAGVRFYTYITTMAYAMEAAAQQQLAFYVLDRPNPLGGERLEGPMLDKERTSFVGYFPMPVRMAMTIGEMAQMFNAENEIHCDLHVISMHNWRRQFWFEDTGLRWVSPSPNLRTTRAELVYPGLEILQSAGVSVGRGTERPFELMGAPWIRERQFTAHMNHQSLAGVRFAPVRFTPTSGLYQGEECHGVRMVVTGRAAFESMRMGVELAHALRQLYPQHFDVQKLVVLLGNATTVHRLEMGESAGAIVSGWDADLRAFRKMRAKYLLYR